MFRRGKDRDKVKGKGPAANRLRDAAEPNVLADWSAADVADEIDSEDAFEENLEPEDEPAEDEVDEEGEDGEEADGRTPAQRRAELEAELQRQAEEFGLVGDNPVGLYGPNGKEVAALLDSLAEIDDDLAEAIADAYEAIPDPERKVAQSVVRRRHRGRDRELELEAAEQGVADWLSALVLNDQDASLYTIVADAATDAVDALVLADELDDADFETLYGPWSEVMEAEEDEAEAGEEEGDAATTASETAGERAEAAEPEGEFGPNTALVIDFLRRLEELETAQTAELVATWREQPKEELRAAHRAVQELADEDAAWREQLRLAQEEVFGWMEGRVSRFSDRSFSPRDNIRIRESAGPVLADSIAALVLADILEPEDAVTLYAPWAEVVGTPELPAFEADDGDEDE
jgi:hypothetical protein